MQCRFQGWTFQDASFLARFTTHTGAFERHVWFSPASSFKPMSFVELVFLWAACKYLSFYCAGTRNNCFSFLLLPLLFFPFVLLYGCIALPSVSEITVLGFLFTEEHFSTPPSEEYCFPAHAWVCRYYTYVRVFWMYIQRDSQFCCIDKHLCTYMCMCSGGFKHIFCCFFVL